MADTQASIAGKIRGRAFNARTLIAYPPFGDGRMPVYALEKTLSSSQVMACRDLGDILRGERLVSMLIPWRIGTYDTTELEHFRSSTYPQGVARANFTTEGYLTERLTHDRLPEPSGFIRVLRTGAHTRIAVNLDWPDDSAIHGEMDVIVCER